QVGMANNEGPADFRLVECQSALFVFTRRWANPWLQLGRRHDAQDHDSNTDPAVSWGQKTEGGIGTQQLHQESENAGTTRWRATSRPAAGSRRSRQNITPTNSAITRATGRGCDRTSGRIDD